MIGGGHRSVASSGLWTPPARSRLTRAIYAGVEVLHRQRPQVFEIDVDDALESARKATGLSDFAGLDFVPRLKVLLASMREEAQLNAVGWKWASEGLIGTMLQNRLELARSRRVAPGVFEQQILRPIIILGGFRTGTTLLHRLLAASPVLRAPLLWEMLSVGAVVRGNPREVRRARRRVEIAHYVPYTLNPTMSLIHQTQPSAPEECIMLMGTDVRNWGLYSCMNVPSYAAALEREHFSESYARHRSMLQLLQRPEDGRRWVLKAPWHLAHLRELLDTYPDAVIVHTHRDPTTVVSSACSLFATYRSTFSDLVDPLLVGRQVLHTLSQWFRRSLATRKNLCGQSGWQFVDVHYDELISDPIRVVKLIYEVAGLSFGADSETATRAYMERDARSERARAKHVYSPTMFGLDPHEAWEHFAEYAEYFCIRRRTQSVPVPARADRGASSRAPFVK